MPNYKVGDIVLVKSIAGDCIPRIHVRLTERVIVKPTPGKIVGFRKTMDWPGYSGWLAEVLYRDEIDNLRKNWSIPFENPGDSTFVYDSSIIKKPRKKKYDSNRKELNKDKKERIVRKIKK